MNPISKVFKKHENFEIKAYVYIMHRQKPIDHFKSKHTKSSKAPNFLSPKILRKIYDSCMYECNLIKKKR